MKRLLLKGCGWKTGLKPGKKGTGTAEVLRRGQAPQRGKKGKRGKKGTGTAEVGTAEVV